MKKFAALLLCLLLLVSLTGCVGQSKSVRYAKSCWDRIGSASVDVDNIYFMQYTSRTHLSDEVLGTAMYSQIPSRGYVILYHSYAFRDGAFMDSYACFLDEDGDLVFSFDYEESNDLYEKYYANFSIYNIEAGEKALEHLENCNYIAGMINHASDVAEEKATGKNVWCAFTEAQIKKATK